MTIFLSKQCKFNMSVVHTRTFTLHVYLLWVRMQFTRHLFSVSQSSGGFLLTTTTKRAQKTSDQSNDNIDQESPQKKEYEIQFFQLLASCKIFSDNLPPLTVVAS